MHNGPFTNNREAVCERILSVCKKSGLPHKLEEVEIDKVYLRRNITKCPPIISQRQPNAN